MFSSILMLLDLDNHPQGNHGLNPDEGKTDISLLDFVTGWIFPGPDFQAVVHRTF